MPDADETQPATGASDAPSQASSWKRRLRRFDRVLNRKSSSPKVRNILLIVSLVAFAAIAIFSYLALPDDVEIRWWLMGVLVLLTPLTTLANAMEYQVMAQIAGTRPRFFESVRLTLIATAANLLPIPGGIMIRTQALRAEGVSAKRALGVNAVAGGAWVSVGAIATGGLMLGSGRLWWVGLLVLLVGIAATVTVWFLIRKVAPDRAVYMLIKLMLVEVATVVVTALRMFVAFAALSTTINLLQAVALTTPTILAAMIGIFPAGLGLREVLAGVVGLAVDLPVIGSVAATAADRVTAQIALAMMTGLTLLIGGRKMLNAGFRQKSDLDEPAIPAAADDQVADDPAVEKPRR